MIRRTALIFVVAAAALVPAGPVVAGAAGAPGAGLPDGAAARATVQLSIDKITPQVPRDPAAPIKLTGTLTNTGNTALTALRVRLHYSARPFQQRADLAAYVSGQGVFDPSYNTFTAIPQVEAGGKAPFEVTTTATALKMSGFGVYPLTVEIIDSLGQQVALQRTFLTYAPKGEKLPRTRLAVALPIIDQPHRADDATFMDDSLRKSLGGGRLARLLRIAQSPPKGVTWFVDPALLDDVRQTTKAYTVKTGDDVETRPADPAAGTWLAGLRAALADASVVATPYADPDVTALVHNGVDDATGDAVRTGGEVAQSLLGRTVQATTNWPYSGVIDRDGLDELAVNGVRTLLLSSSSLPPETPAPTTHDAATTLDTVAGEVTVLLADTTLSSIVDSATTASGMTTAARQRFIAETAMITAEDPEVTRTVVAAPRRRWDPDPEAVKDLLGTAGSLPWLRPVTLDSIKPGGKQVPRSDLVYSAEHRQSELSRAYLREVRDLAGKSDLTSTVTESQARPFDAALLRLGSSAWRGRGAAANQHIEQVREAVEAQINKISITGRGQPRLLAGANGTVGISVQNKLDLPVDLLIGVKSNDPQRLMIDTYRRDLSIEPGNTTTIQVPMRAPRGGDTTVTVQLATEHGVPYGDPVVLKVSATGYTGIAAVIVGGALTVMLAAVVMRLLRRRTNRSAGRRREGTR